MNDRATLKCEKCSKDEFHIVYQNGTLAAVCTWCPGTVILGIVRLDEGLKPE